MVRGRSKKPAGEPGETTAAAPDTPSAPDASPQAGASRRDFLKFGGVAAAGAVVGGGAGAAIGAAVGHASGFAEGADDFTALAARSEPGFDHLVVVMGENRSFDNLLGWLYTPDTLPDGQTFDGLAFGDYSNTAPDGTVVPVHVYDGATDVVMRAPDPDPGEEYPHVNTQLFGIVDPPDNASLPVGDMSAPYNAPKPGESPKMNGFLQDYIVNYERLKKGKQPTADEASQIMGSFSPEMLPVLSTLAKNFAVFDAWHCAVPSQTFCNRSFFHASTSHGFVTNKHSGGYDKWFDAPDKPTVFNRLEEAGISWRIYFDELQLVSYTGVLHAPVLEQYWRTERFATMAQFYDDVQNGTLPAYAFVEPRLVYNHNDFHPPVGKLKESEVDGEEVIDSAVSDVRAGELLIHQIYDAIRTSASTEGSNALNTMLLITFDEHGGTYDHVPPPPGTPPEAGAPEGEMGFAFDRLGLRVPAIAVSAYTRAGTVIHDEMHHAAVIATLSRLHGLKPLTRRDEGANTLFNVVNSEAPRHPSTWPHTTPQYLPPNPQAEAPHPAHVHKDKPLSPPAKGLLGLLIAKYGDGEPEPETYADAYELLHKHGVGLFGAPQATQSPAATQAPTASKASQ
ncbi:alkaline phosphatase family protein [Agromyces aerolatus]|uniref:alkaline phosphatase family protein n=1 Tax=Agromyces sp. LY-1074 TaxID=3074080 RepID=UPI0028665225|nr:MULTISPECIES: alkaline phosphatase family protein [unclassified Agromyces]MDR5699911.1 alkaline phosphatase family protein [Agromyces sp. LY-1074]MDR5706277.1 alkaline phosphatase family protein [Agromyces sp. LY-1358]